MRACSFVRWVNIFVMALSLSVSYIAIGKGEGEDVVKVAKSSSKGKIKYRTILNDKAYTRQSSKDHLAIKITPPVKKGKGEYIYVEIYNYTPIHLGTVDFDIAFTDEWAYDLTSHINGANILPKRSCVRKIATPGTGQFNPIKDLEISNLQVISADAASLTYPIFVDLVKPAASTKKTDKK